MSRLGLALAGLLGVAAASAWIVAARAAGTVEVVLGLLVGTAGAPLARARLCADRRDLRDGRTLLFLFGGGLLACAGAAAIAWRTSGLAWLSGFEPSLLRQAIAAVLMALLVAPGACLLVLLLAISLLPAPAPRDACALPASACLIGGAMASLAILSCRMVAALGRSPKLAGGAALALALAVGLFVAARLFAPRLLGSRMAAALASLFVLALLAGIRLPHALGLAPKGTAWAGLALGPAGAAWLALALAWAPPAGARTSWPARLAAASAGATLPLIGVLLAIAMPLHAAVAATAPLVVAFRAGGVSGRRTWLWTAPLLCVVAAGAIGLRPRWAALSAWRLGLHPSFACDGRAEAVLIDGGRMIVGDRVRERRSLGRSSVATIFQALVPYALRPTSRRALVMGAAPGLIEELERTRRVAIDVVEPEPAALEATALLWSDFSRAHVRSLVRPSPPYDLALARGPLSGRGLALIRRVLVDGGIFSCSFSLADLSEGELRQALDAIAAAFPSLVIALPDEHDLVVLAATAPLRLDPEPLVRALAEPGVAPSALRAGMGSFEGLFARVLGGRPWLEALRARPERRGRRPVVLVSLQAQTPALPPDDLLAPGGDHKRLYIALADRIITGAASGELPGWRARAVLEATRALLPAATRDRLEALVLQCEGRDGEAEALLDDAARLAPDDVVLGRQRGRLELDRQEIDAARTQLARVYAQTGQSSDRLLLAEALALDGDPTARLHLQALRATEPRAHYWLGVLDVREQHLDPAQQHFSDFARLVPDDDDVYYQLGSIAWHKGQLEKARGLFQRGARNGAHAAAEDAQLGARRLEDGDVLGALVLLRRALAHDRSNATLRRTLTRAHASLARGASMVRAPEEPEEPEELEGP